MTVADIDVVKPHQPDDRTEALAIASAAGVQGVYVANSLVQGASDPLLLMRDGGVDAAGLAWFGKRGNLIVLTRRPLDGDRCASLLRERGAEWRIALGPADVLDALASRESSRPLVNRWQTYYRAGRENVAAELIDPGVRPAQRKDVGPLVRAALDLNHSDLNVAPWRVQRAWLRESVKRRIREQRTYVIGDPGDPLCKLDLGSQGAAGIVIEGVHTRVDARGQGLAARLVASVIHRFAADATACLHVAETNRAARRCYERVGMAADGRCRIVLRA